MFWWHVNALRTKRAKTLSSYTLRVERERRACAVELNKISKLSVLNNLGGKLTKKQWTLLTALFPRYYEDYCKLLVRFYEKNLKMSANTSLWDVTAVCSFSVKKRQLDNQNVWLRTKWGIYVHGCRLLRNINLSVKIETDSKHPLNQEDQLLSVNFNLNAPKLEQSSNKSHSETSNYTWSPK